MAMNRKASSTESTEASQKTSSDNSQDWVCIKCNNLNFSFRKKCNRCKVQSREDNQQAIYLDYYYYNQYYQYSAPSFEKRTESTEALSESQLISNEPKTPVKKSFVSESTIPDRDSKGLPSVSPLVKKYKAGQSKKRKDLTKTGWKGEPIQKLFGEQLWNCGEFQEIDIKFQEKSLQATDDEQSREEFIRSVEKMII